MMQDYQLRVIDEFQELESRVVKLKVFIKSDKFNKLDEINRSLLFKQLDYMNEYADILQYRIALFK